ncbi:MAG: DUF1330 domain-containing protein [Bryobacteraceae bacterium]|nr:DUF1330 domain-containing protein [Bryobacteraceae bacterium]
MQTGFQVTVGLSVIDDETYARYRAEMTPLLEAAGGRFRFDFEIANVLKSEASHVINRVFTMHFPDRESRERFFQDPAYLEIRARLFEKAVRGVTVISEG